MRFRFCGDLDCPDWVLAEINILARLMKKVEKITADAKYESGDVKASIAGIKYIISSAAKHNVDEEILSSELQQLGLPKEHSVSLCKAYGGKMSSLKEQFRKESFRKSNNMKEVTWKIDEESPSGMLSASGIPEEKTLIVPSDKLRVLLHELRTAQNLLNSY